MPEPAADGSGEPRRAPLSLTSRAAQLRLEGGAVECLAGEAAQRRLGPFKNARHELAVHEASHVIVAFSQGRLASRVSIAPPAAVAQAHDLVGYAVYNKGGDVTTAIHIRARGRLSSDERQALLLLSAADPDAGWRTLRGRFRMARRRAEDLVVYCVFEIEFLAARLLERGEMAGEEIRATICEARREQSLARLQELGEHRELGRMNARAVPGFLRPRNSWNRE